MTLLFLVNYEQTRYNIATIAFLCPKVQVKLYVQMLLISERFQVFQCSFLNWKTLLGDHITYSISNVFVRPRFNTGYQLIVDLPEADLHNIY